MHYADAYTYWVALFCNRIDIVYFVNLDVEHFPKEIKEFSRNKNRKANIFRVQADNSGMCGYFCTGFIDFMLVLLILVLLLLLIRILCLFSPYDFKKNGYIILSYFKDEQC